MMKLAKLSKVLLVMVLAASQPVYADGPKRSVLKSCMVIVCAFFLLAIGKHLRAPCQELLAQGSAPVPDDSDYLGSWYLSFPLGPRQGPLRQGPLSKLINSVFDHSVPKGFYLGNRDGVILSFTAERAAREFLFHLDAKGNEDGLYAGNREGTYQFLLGGAYKAGSWGSAWLSYDGHPGIDYHANKGDEIFAAAPGILRYPTSDDTKIYVGNPFQCYGAIYIDHQNGFQTWYLHGTNPLPDGTTVHRGDPIARVGTVSCRDPVGPHLHFELRRRGLEDLYQPVDPYGYNGCDPYLPAINTNLWWNSGTRWTFEGTGNSQGWSPRNVECFTVNNDRLNINPDTSDPYIESPPLVNVMASEFNTVEFKMASSAPGKKGYVYFSATEPQGPNQPLYSYPNCIEFDVINDGLSHPYFVRMDAPARSCIVGHPAWRGKITGIRIDPSDTGIRGSNSDTVWFEEIALSQSTSVTGGGSPTANIERLFQIAYSLESSDLVAPLDRVREFTNFLYTPAVKGYYQDFKGTWTMATINLLESNSRAFSVKHGFSRLYHSVDGQSGLPVYKLLVAPLQNEAPSIQSSVVGNRYTWQPFLKGGMFFYHTDTLGKGFKDWNTFTSGYLAERYEREGGRLGSMGLPLFPPTRAEDLDQWERSFQWFEKGFIWLYRSTPSGQVWTYAFHKETDVYSNGQWIHRGWEPHQ